MCGMRSRGRLRAGVGRIGLLPLAAFAVHQLRYELAYGPAAAAELHDTGHSYLHSAVPWLVTLLALTVGGFVWRAAGALRGRPAPSRRRSFAGVWAVCAAALVMIFACQETLEGIFATGHPGGFAAVFGDGGWWAVPLAVAIGLILALAFHGAWWVVRTLAALSRRQAGRRSASVPPRPLARSFLAAPAPLVAGWSTRGPPS